MKLDFTGLSYAPKWYDFETGKPILAPEEKPALQIRPYPPELRKLILKDGGIVINGAESQKIFMYCLTGMANFIDASDKQIVCSEAVKAEIYKYDMAGIPLFVLGKSREYENAKAASEKNF
jgi:hypothetical protein